MRAYSQLKSDADFDGPYFTGTSTGGVRNVSMTSKKTGPKSASSRPSTDEIFNDEYSKRGLQPSYLGQNEEKKKEVTSTEGEENNFDNTSAVEETRWVAQQQQRALYIQKKRREAKLLLKKKSAIIAKVKVTRLNMMIWSWGTFLWLFIQLPLALLGLVAFGAAYAINEISNYVKPLSYIRAGVDYVADKLNLTTVQAVLTVIDPMNLFLVTYILILVMAIIFMLFVYLAYKTALINPIFGEGAPLKIGMLLLAIIGYALPIPLLNIFPWYMVWTGAVWLKPK